jgi:hypothetical protein
MDGKGKKTLVSVFRREGEWDEKCVKVLREMGFTQELPVEGESVPTPKHVFVKYDRGASPAAMRDAVLDRLEKVLPKEDKSKVYVVVTDDLVPLLVEEVAAKKK